MSDNSKLFKEKIIYFVKLYSVNILLICMIKLCTHMPLIMSGDKLILTITQGYFWLNVKISPRLKTELKMPVILRLIIQNNISQIHSTNDEMTFIRTT